MTPIDYGWKLTHDKEYLCINWFEGEQVPQEVEDIEAGFELDDDDDADCNDLGSDDENDDLCISENEDDDPTETDSESDSDLL